MSEEGQRLNEVATGDRDSNEYIDTFLDQGNVFVVLLSHIQPVYDAHDGRPEEAGCGCQCRREHAVGMALLTGGYARQTVQGRPPTVEGDAERGRVGQAGSSRLPPCETCDGIAGDVAATPYCVRTTRTPTTRIRSYREEAYQAVRPLPGDRWTHSSAMTERCRSDVFAEQSSSSAHAAV